MEIINILQKNKFKIYKYAFLYIYMYTINEYFWKGNKMSSIDIAPGAIAKMKMQYKEMHFAKATSADRCVPFVTFSLESFFWK